jgi:hypothetical protein
MRELIVSFAIQESPQKLTIFVIDAYTTGVGDAGYATGGELCFLAMRPGLV